MSGHVLSQQVRRQSCFLWYSLASHLRRNRLLFSRSGARPEDGVEDMTVISEIDEKGINVNLRVRYNRDQIYVSVLK